MNLIFKTRTIAAKLAAVSVCAILLCALLAGCGEKPLAASFDADQVKTAAETCISSLNAGDYDAVAKTYSPALQTALGDSKLQDSVAPLIEKAGAFVEYTSEQVVGTTNKQTGADLATCVVSAKYENTKITYTITLNTDMQLDGLYLR